MLDFDATQYALERLGANVDAAEAHGTLCALLLDNAPFASWIEHTVVAPPAAGDVIADEQFAELEALYVDTRERLAHEDLDFALLLPDDSEDFSARLLALASWCQGFLYGLGVTGAGDSDALDEVARECLSDLVEISKLSHDEEGSDEAEGQYLEIVEHVRMAILLLNESLNPLEPPPSTVH